MTFVLERCVLRFLCSRSTDGTSLIDSMENLNKIFDYFKNRSDIARGIITLLKSMANYGWIKILILYSIRICLFLNISDDAIDEMISTKIDESLLYEIKRFHSDNDVSILVMNNFKADLSVSFSSF